jgi:hypothetical protein
MSQPGNFTPILLYGSSTPGNVPLAANLTNSATGSEIAINVADKNLFFKDSGGTVNTVPIRQSSTSSNGWLSSTDWNTFNNKAPAGAYLTAVTADSPLSGSGTSASHLVIAQANTSTSGYLSSTDWNTFNSKQTALVSGTNIKTVGGVTLLGSGDVGTIGTGYGGTGLTSFTANGIVYASSSSVLATSGNFVYIPGTNKVNLLFSSATTWAANTSSPNISIQNSSATASSTALFQAQVVDNSSTTGGVLFGAIAVDSGISGGYSADFVVANRNVGTYQENMRVFYNGGVRHINTISVGNATPSTSGAGITFPATQSASSDVNTLDDYEEGTFAATFLSDGGSITTDGTIRYGFYTKIGRQVTVTCNVKASAISSPTGDVYIFTLPFASSSTTGTFSAVSIECNNLAATAVTQIMGVIPGGASYIVFNKYSAGSLSVMAAQMQANTNFYVTATYFTAT